MKIINNKRIDLTADEFSTYQEICRAYDRENFQGEELFKDHFQTDKFGMILSVTPPPNRQTTMEVYMFLMNVQANQQMRVNRKIIDSLIKEASEKIVALTNEVNDLKDKVNESISK